MLRQRIWNRQNIFFGFGPIFTLLLVLAPGEGLESAQRKIFENCDFVYNLGVGTTVLESPYYPLNYPAKSSCRYKLIAPLDHGIRAECTIDLPKTPRADYLHISRDSSNNLHFSDGLTGKGTIERKSLFRTMTLAYASAGGRGNFKCILEVAPRPCDCGWSIDSRIMNGMEATPNEYPSVAAIRNRFSNWPAFCGASIVSHYFLLTAAHCTNEYPDPTVLVALVGDHDLSMDTDTYYQSQYDISQKFEHPYYNHAMGINDIAILQTSKPIEWSRGVGPICLPPMLAINNTFDFEYVNVVGWGTLTFGGIKPNTLQKVQLMIANHLACEATYQNESISASSHICTYDNQGRRRDSCTQDSGGPIILRKTRQFQIGLITSGRECGHGTHSMGINTRITSYLTWIRHVTQYTTCQVPLI